MTRPYRAPVTQNGILGPENPKSVTSRSVTWRCLTENPKSVTSRSVTWRCLIVYPYPKNTPNSDHGLSFPSPETVSNAALANAALVLSSKDWKNTQDGVQRRKINPKSLGLSSAVRDLVGLRTQTQNAAFFERKGPERKPWPRGESLNRKK